MTKIYLSPRFGDIDRGSDGGIRRVVDAQKKYLPEFGFDITDTPSQADIVAIHAGSNVPVDPDQFIVSHCHGLYWADSIYTWSRWMAVANRDVVASLRVADAVTAPSEWVAQVLRRGMQLSPYVVNHGVDTRGWQLGVNEGYVLWNKLRVDAVSDPTPMNKLAEMCSNINFVSTFGAPQSNVKLTGIVDQHEIVANAGVYLCTTRETFGVGTLEAMACGVPILAFDWGATPEFVKHKIHGWLAPPNDFDSLKEGLYYCIEHRAELGAACRETASLFSWEKAVGEYANVYRSLTKPEVKVTVLITAYNIEKYLQQAIMSVLDNGFEDYELIIVDDCSTDNSPVIGRTYAATDPHVSWFQTPQNLKPAGAFNFGIRRAKGKYILVLDGDNILEPNCLSLLSSQLDQNRGLDIAYGRVRFIQENGELDVQTARSNDGISAWPTEFSWNGQLSHRNQIPSTCMYRKAIFDRIGGYRFRAPPAEDADFWCRAVSFGARATKVTDAVTFTYRMRSDSMSHTNKDWPWHLWYPWLAEPPFASLKENYTPQPFTHNLDMNPKVSVIIPVGPGHEDAIQDALDSVYAQTFKEWECILINDSGQEDLPWVPSWCKVLNTAGKEGVSAARNAGLAVANGKTVLFLDADDYLDSTAIDKLYDAYIKYGGYAYCDFKKVETQEIVHVPDKACEHVSRVLPHPITGIYPNIRAARFDPELMAGEDWDYVAAMTANGYCGTRVPEPLVYYRTKSGTRRQELISNIDKYREIISLKWGGKMAGCGGCGKGAQAAPIQAQQTQAANDELILLEFVANGMHNVTYRGQTTGQMYRFSSGTKRYVRREDVNGFLERVSEFRIAQPGNVATNAPINV